MRDTVKNVMHVDQACIGYGVAIMISMETHMNLNVKHVLLAITLTRNEMDLSANGAWKGPTVRQGQQPVRPARQVPTNPLCSRPIVMPVLRGPTSPTPALASVSSARLARSATTRPRVAAPALGNVRFAPTQSKH